MGGGGEGESWIGYTRREHARERARAATACGGGGFSHFRSSSSAVFTRSCEYWMNSEKRKAKALSPTSFLPRIGSGRSSADRPRRDMVWQPGVLGARVRRAVRRTAHSRTREFVVLGACVGVCHIVWSQRGHFLYRIHIIPNSHARVRIRRCANTSNTNRKNEYAFAITHSVSRRRIADSEYAFDVSCSKRSDRILSTEFVFAIRYSLFTA